jgi:hypothetical protein
VRSSLAYWKENTYRALARVGNGAENAAVGGSSTRTMAEQKGGGRSCTKARLRSGSPPLVAIVKSADLRKGDDLALVRRLYQARFWAILFEGEVGPGVVVISQVG